MAAERACAAVRENAAHSILSAGAEDPSQQTRMAAFLNALHQAGWSEGRNLQIDYRSGLGDAANMRRYAAELVGLAEDVILVFGTSAIAPMLQATRTVPIVFANVADPVGAGFVDSLARPGGNATGFMQFEYSLAGKWPELLREIAPGVTRAAVLRDAAISSGVGQFAVIQAVAPSLGIEVSPINILDGGEIERWPVQVPTKYELAINLKTAKSLGLVVPPTLLARADELIG